MSRNPIKTSFIHLKGFVYVKSEPDGVAEEEDEDNGEEESCHGSVSPVLGGDQVVVCCGPEVHQTVRLREEKASNIKIYRMKLETN